MKKLTLISILLICVLAFGGCGHEHNWYKIRTDDDEGKCNQYKCYVCEETSNEEHEWEEWEHIDGSCEQADKKVRKCKNCGNEEEQVISEAPGHKYGKWKVVTKATCTEKEIKKRECLICGNEEEQVISEALGHKLGDWKITKNATLTKKGKREKRCEKCGEVIETEKYSLSKNEKKQYLYDHCQNYSYETIARYPDKYKGKYAKFTGEVVQVIDKRTYRVNITRVHYEYIEDDYTDTIYVTLDDSVNLGYNILDDDIITIYGILDGEYSYETVLGSGMTIPSVIAYHIQR